MAFLGSTHRICPLALAFLHEIQDDYHEDSIHALGACVAAFFAGEACAVGGIPGAVVHDATFRPLTPLFASAERNQRTEPNQRVTAL